MDEEVEVDTGALGGLDFAKLRTDPAAVLGDVYKQQMAAQQMEEASAKDRYEAARARIEARNQGPSTSEQLFAISQALLAPRKYRGIAGTIGKLSGAFGDISAAQRRAEMSREEQLAKFDEAYGMRRAALGTQSAKMAGELVRTAAPLLKPKDSRQYDQDRGVFVDKGNIRPTQNSYTDPKTGRTFVEWQDGYWRERQPDGGYKVFEREGADWVEIGIEGAR
jgi:hypothetical protein